MLRRLLGLDDQMPYASLCPSCGAVAESDPCPVCGSPLLPGPTPAALALVAALWLVSILGVATGVNILRGNSPVLHPGSGALFFLSLPLTLGVTLLWMLRHRWRTEAPEEPGEG